MTTSGAGTLLSNQSNKEDLKRHSRSLDLQPTNTTSSTKIRHLHTRSASESDGLDLIIAAAAAAAVENTIPTDTTTKSTTRSNSVFSLYKKLGSPNRSQSIHSTNDVIKTTKSRASIGFAFSSFLQQNNKKQQHRYSTPIESPDITMVINPWMKQPTIDEENKTPTYLLGQKGDSKRSLPSSLQQEINQFSIDGFARRYFATHKRGLFRRTVPMDELLCWTKDSIRQPLLLPNKPYAKEAIKCFKIIQMLMNDRQRPRQFQFIESFQYLLNCGIEKGQMRDEIYVQICRQLNKNPKIESTRKGWEILGVVSITFPPSKNLESYLFQFVKHYHSITQNQLNVLSLYVFEKLTAICSKGARGKVLTASEIERAMEAPFKPSVFGESLDTIMNLQKEQEPALKIPKLVIFLSNAVHDLNGFTTEGIFRVPGDIDAVTELRIRLENGNYDLTDVDDPSIPASLLKYWLRDLAEPLIPTELYQECIRGAQEKSKCIDILNRLSSTNRRTLLYMIGFLQEFNTPDVIEHTRMNVFNLAMIFAPNFLRCPYDNLTTVFENSKYEQTFVRTLIAELKVDKDQCAYGQEEVFVR
ncbi:Rho GTPase activation protein [Choanephora cucurbitarum]|nr:Rho GTPase activation protein [Choanephora cucurbitarum]